MAAQDLYDDVGPMQEESDLEGFVGYQLKRAYVIVQNDFRAALGRDGLAPRVFSALSLVVQYPNITQSQLARTLGIERSGLVAIVDELEQKGFMERTHVPGDRRVQALVPTEAGRDAYARSRDEAYAHEHRLFSHFTETEYVTLMRLLKKIREANAEA